MIERLTQQQKEELLGSYFAGTMSTADEQEFFVQVALDDDLRQMLKAHSVVRSALDSGRSLPLADHHAARERLMMSLAARHAEPAQLPERRSALPWFTGLLVVATISILAGYLLEPGAPAANRSVAAADNTGRWLRVMKEGAAIPAEPIAPSLEKKADAGGSSIAQNKVAAVATTSRPRVNGNSRSTTEDAPAGKGSIDTAASPRVSTPATRSAMDTIRGKSRDTLVMRLKVRKVVE